MEPVETPVDQKVQEEQTPEKEEFECAQCTFKTGTQKYLRKHVRRMHPEGGFHCLGCEEAFDNRKALKDHMKGCTQLSDKAMSSGESSARSCSSPGPLMKKSRKDYIEKAKQYALPPSHMPREEACTRRELE